MPKVIHHVFFNFNPNMTTQKIQECFALLNTMKDNISDINKISFKENNSPEKLNQNFTHVMVMEFSTTAARDNYLTHPAHIKIAEKLISDKMIDVPDGVLVFDYLTD